MQRNRIVTALSAETGAGKTEVGLAHATLLYTLKKINFLVIAVPLQNIKTNWGRRAKKFNLNLVDDLKSRNLWKAVHGFNKEIDGIVCTYSQISRNIDLFKIILQDKKVGLICDEVHHMGESNTWGQAFDEIFHNAFSILALTGTPWRSDGTAIPFLNYNDDGSLQTDFNYTYLNGLEDGYLREIDFHNYDGLQEWREGTEVISKNFVDEIDIKGCSRRLRTALLSDGGLIDRMIVDANITLDLQSRRFPAKGLALAIDQQHARYIARKILDLTGHTPFLAITDNCTTSKKLDDFSKDHSIRYGVTCKKFGEGYNCPYISTIIYATNVKQELAYKQNIGRALRMLPGLNREHQHATVFQPGDLTLQGYANEYEIQKTYFLSTQSESNANGGGGRGVGDFTPLSSKGRRVNTIRKGIELIKYSEVEEKNKYEILEETTDEISYSEEHQEISRICNRYINRVAADTGESQREVNLRFFKDGGKRVSDSSIKDLEFKKRWLELEMNRLGIYSK